MREKLDIRLDAIVIPKRMLNIQTPKEQEAFLFFIRLLLLANTVDTEWVGLMIPRGSFVTSYRELAEQFGMSVQKVRTLVLRNVNQHTINTASTHQLTHITICDYDSYTGVQHSNQHTIQHTINTAGTKEIDSSHTHDNSQDNNIKYNIINNTADKGSRIEGKVEEEETTLFPDVEKEEKKKTLQKKKSIADDVEKLYSLYPTKCPMRNSATHKGEKCKVKLKSLLTTHRAEDLEAIIKRYVDETYGKQYLKDFLTFLNNLPDYSEPEEKKPAEEDWRESKKNFWKKDFDEHPDEFKAMDYELRRIINRGLPLKWENGKWIKG